MRRGKVRGAALGEGDQVRIEQLVLIQQAVVVGIQGPDDDCVRVWVLCDRVREAQRLLQTGCHEIVPGQHEVLAQGRDQPSAPCGRVGIDLNQDKLALIHREAIVARHTGKEGPGC